MLKNLAIIGTMALMVLLLSPFPAIAIGIGIGPSEYKITGAMRGGEYDRSIAIFNPDENANNFTLRTVGEAGEWIKFYKIEDVNNPVKEITINPNSNYPVLVKIIIPSDMPAGAYNATIYAETIPGGTKGMTTGVDTKLQASMDIFVEVTGEQVMDGEVNSIVVENTEPEYPVRVKTVFENTGNVQAKPNIEISILQDNKTITAFIHDSTKVKPTSIEPIITEWNTTDKNTPGDYIASVNVSLEGRPLRSEKVSFKIMPPGTFTRQGDLISIIIEGEPAIDTVAKVKAVFQNTGQIETPAKFSAEVYKENKMIDTLSSDELTVLKNKEIVLISYLKITSPGDYLIKGKVIYSGKETPVKEYTLKIPKSTPGFDPLYVVFVLIIFSIINRRRSGGIK
jgi:hypothetical protein